MRVGVRFVGLVRNVVGCDQEEVALPPGARIRELLEALQEKYGEELRTSLRHASGELRSTCHILVGEQEIGELQGLDTPVPPDAGVAVVVMVYPSEGG